MLKIKFYSEHNIVLSWQIERIIEKVNDKAIEFDWDINDLIEFHNILKYINVDRICSYIFKQTSIDIKKYEKKIKQRMGKFVDFHKDNFINLYEMIEFDDNDDFFEVFEIYKVYKKIEIIKFRRFLEKENVHIYSILKFKRLTEYFDEVIKDALLSAPINAEIILSKYLKEDELYLPPSLTETDILNLIDKYIDSPLANINELRKIINYPSNKGLNIIDKIKLNAKRKAEKEERKLFNNEIGIESKVKISYLKEQGEAILISSNGRTADIKISRKWIEENIDYPTLWNNFIYLFEFVDRNMRLALDSKKSESTTLESTMIIQAEHLYYQSTRFLFKEMLSTAEIYSYVNVLNTLGVKIEEMIEWFFEVYLNEEFQINNFIVRMPSSEASYIEKCRTILPEIDRIFKQYNTLIEDGMIDQELIQISSSSFKIKDIKSFNNKKYVYSSGE